MDEHIDFVEGTRTCDVQGLFCGAAGFNILTVSGWTPYRNRTDMLALWAQYFDTGTGSDVESVFVVDGHTVRLGLDSTQTVVPTAPALQRAEVAPVTHETIRPDIPRDDMGG